MVHPLDYMRRTSHTAVAAMGETEGMAEFMIAVLIALSVSLLSMLSCVCPDRNLATEIIDDCEDRQKAKHKVQPGEEKINISNAKRPDIPTLIYI